MTEWPLTKTPGEFWSLVYDYECSAVVILCVPPPNSVSFFYGVSEGYNIVVFQQSYPSFWPEGRHSKKYGPVFTIDHISHNHYTNIKTWVFRINKKVRIFTFFKLWKLIDFFSLDCLANGVDGGR